MNGTYIARIGFRIVVEVFRVILIIIVGLEYGFEDRHRFDGRRGYWISIRYQGLGGKKRNSSEADVMDDSASLG